MRAKFALVRCECAKTFKMCNYIYQAFSQVFWQKKRPKFPIFTQLLSQQVQQPYNATVSQGQPIMSHQASQQQQQGHPIMSHQASQQQQQFQQQQLQQQQVLQESAQRLLKCVCIWPVLGCTVVFKVLAEHDDLLTH